MQIWIIPPKKGLDKLYGSCKFQAIDRKDKLLKIVSSKNSDAKVKIHQDVNIYVSELEKDKNIVFEIKEDKQVYFVQIEGNSNINGIQLEYGDAMEIIDENIIMISAIENSHFLFLEV